MKLEQIRKNLGVVMSGIPEFTKSTRGRWLYNARDINGKKVKVQFDGNNFRVMVGDLETLIKSIPMSKLDINGVEPYLRAVLTR